MKSELRISLVWLFVCVCFILVWAPSAQATTNPFGVGVVAPDIAEGPGWWQRLMDWVTVRQSRFYQMLTASLKAMRDNPATGWSLVLVSFFYGIFHAAGPGHGKAVISSYMLASHRTLRFGIGLAFMAAFVQGMSALVIVLVLAGLLQSTSTAMNTASLWVELASYALVFLLGLWLLLRKGRRLIALLRGRAGEADVGAAHAHDNHHHDHHHHDHGHHDHHHAHHHAAHDHVHGDDCGCGHDHMPDASHIERFWSKEALSAVFAIGMRPCSGALIVLVFALSQGLFWAGVMSTFVMALGTAITVSVIAVLTVTARHLAERLFGGRDGRLALVWIGLESLAALCVMLLGLLLLAAGWQAV